MPQLEVSTDGGREGSPASEASINSPEVRIFIRCSCKPRCRSALWQHWSGGGGLHCHAHRDHPPHRRSQAMLCTTPQAAKWGEIGKTTKKCNKKKVFF